MHFLRSLVVFSIAITSSVTAAPKIGVLLRDHDLFYSAVERGAVETAAQLGAEVIVKAPARANATSQQLTLLGTLGREHLDALIVAPLTVAEFKQPLADLAAKGVKIVLIEISIPESSYPLVGYDQAEMATTAAHTMADLIKDGDEITLVRANSLEGMTVREKTLIATLKNLRPKSPLHTDFMSGLEKGDDAAQVTKAIEAHPTTKLLCTAFTASTLGGIQVIKEKSLAGKVLQAGFGSGLPDEAVAAIENNSLQLWVSQQPKMIGRKAVEAAMDLIQGKAVPQNVSVPYALVTKTNLSSPEIQSIRK